MKKIELKQLIKEILNEFRAQRSYDSLEESNSVGSKTYKFYNIDYETDGEDVDDLPSEIIYTSDDPEFDPEYEGADIISDETGWLVNSFEYEEVDSLEERNSDSCEVKGPVASDYINENTLKVIKSIIKEESRKLTGVQNILVEINKELSKISKTCYASDDLNTHMIYIHDGNGGMSFSGRINVIGENCYNVYLMKNDMYLRELNVSGDKVKEYIKILGENLDGGRWKLFLDRKEILVAQSNLTEDKMKDAAKTTIFTVKSPKYDVESKQQFIKTKEITCCKNMTDASKYTPSSKKSMDNKHPKQANGTVAKKSMKSDNGGEVKKKKDHTLKIK
jgi:hypothetical protein